MCKIVLYALLLILPVTKNEQKDNVVNKTEIDSIALKSQLEKIIQTEYSNPSMAIIQFDELLEKSYYIPELKLLIYHHQSEMLIKTGQHDKALTLLKKAIVLAKKRKSKEILGEYYISIGFIYYCKSEYDSSNHFTNKAEKLFLSLNDSLGLARVKVNRSNILNVKGNYTQVLKLNIEAASIFEKYNEFDKLALIYNNIGMANHEHGFFAEAVKYLTKAVNVSLNLKDSLQLEMDYINLGIVYRKQDSLDRAEETYLKALNIAKNLNLEEDIARVSLNLGLVLTNKQQYEKAISFYTISLKKCEKLSLSFGIMANLINIGDLYLQKGNFQKAEFYSLKALSYVEKLKLPREKAVLTENLYNIYKKTGRFPLALKYLEINKIIYDSLLSAEKQRQFLEIQTKYETEKKEHAITLLQKAALKKDSIIMLSSIVVVFFITLLIYRNIKIKRIAQQDAELMRVKMEAQNKELAAKAVLLAKQNDKIRSIGKEIRNKLHANSYEIPPILERVIHSMEKNPKSEKEWEDFDFHFNQINSEFVNNLKKHANNLAGLELRICYLLRLNLSSKEISKYLNLSSGTIDNLRSQIRKKMNLEKNVNLGSFIASL